MKSIWWKILPIALLGIIAFCAVAVSLEIITFDVLPASLIGVLLGALISAIITQYLLSGQTAHEEVKECNVTIFKKKSEMFYNYIEILWNILEQQRLSIDDYDKLRKDFSIRLMIYLNEKNIKCITEYLLKIGEFVDNAEDNYENLKINVFGIINTLSGAINLGGKISIESDTKLERPIYPKMFKRAILNELNNSLKWSLNLSEGQYLNEEQLIDDGEWGGEYICFDFRRFKGCKLLIGSFSKYCPYSSVYMLLFIDKTIQSVDDFRYNYDGDRPSNFDKYVIGIKYIASGKKDENWAELTCSYSDNEEYVALGNFNPPPEGMWLFLDDPEALKLYRNNYRKVAQVIGKRASYWFENGFIFNEKTNENFGIIPFLEKFLGGNKEN